MLLRGYHLRANLTAIPSCAEQLPQLRRVRVHRLQAGHGLVCLLYAAETALKEGQIEPCRRLARVRSYNLIQQAERILQLA